MSRNPIETGFASVADSFGNAVPRPIFVINSAGTQLAYTNSEGRIVIWDITNERRVTTVATTGLADIASLYYSPDGRFLSAKASDGNTITWHANIFTRSDQIDYSSNTLPSSSYFQYRRDNTPLTAQHTVTAGSHRFEFICLQQESMVFQEICSQSIVAVWTTEWVTNSFMRSPMLRDLSTTIVANGFSHDGQWLRLLDNTTNYLYQEIDTTNDTLVNEVIINWADLTGEANIIVLTLGASRLMAMADDTGQVFLADMTQNKVVASLEHDEPVIHLAFNHEGTALATYTQASELVIWEQAGETWSVRGRVQEDPAVMAPINGVAWGVNGEPLTFHGRQVYFYEGETATVVNFNFDVISIAAAPTDQTLVLYSYGDAVTSYSSIYFWDARGRQLFGEVSTQYSGNSLAISPDGQAVVVSGQLSSVGFEGELDFDPYTTLFTVGLPFWQARACTLVNRNLSEAEWAEIMPPGEPYAPTCSE